MSKLTDRLRELSRAAANNDMIEFSMRIPAEPGRDADLVLDEAARLLDSYESRLSSVREQAETWTQPQHDLSLHLAGNRILNILDAAVETGIPLPSPDDAIGQRIQRGESCLSDMARGVETPCSIMEYDDAYRCATHDRTWGAVPEPDEPCAGFVVENHETHTSPVVSGGTAGQHTQEGGVSETRESGYVGMDLAKLGSDWTGYACPKHGQLLYGNRCLTCERESTASERRKPDPGCEGCGGSGKMKGAYDPGEPEDCPLCVDPMDGASDTRVPSCPKCGTDVTRLKCLYELPPDECPRHAVRREWHQQGSA